jgi:hypothetical protein
LRQLPTVASQRRGADPKKAGNRHFSWRTLSWLAALATSVSAIHCFVLSKASLARQVLVATAALAIKAEQQ